MGARAFLKAVCTTPVEGVSAQKSAGRPVSGLKKGRWGRAVAAEAVEGRGVCVEEVVGDVAPPVAEEREDRPAVARAHHLGGGGGCALVGWVYGIYLLWLIHIKLMKYNIIYNNIV